MENKVYKRKCLLYLVGVILFSFFIYKKVGIDPWWEFNMNARIFFLTYFSLMMVYYWYQWRGKYNCCDVCGHTKDEVFVVEYLAEAGIIMCDKCRIEHGEDCLSEHLIE